MREKRISAVIVRALGEKIGSSPKPIFSLFENMEGVLTAVMEDDQNLYQSYLTSHMASEMSYI